MAISFDAIAERYVTFYAGDTAAEGKLCKVTANGTVGACAGGDDFCGVITQVRNGAASVLMGGFGMEMRAFVKNDAFSGDYTTGELNAPSKQEE